MRDFAIVFVHLIVTLARLAGPGGLRAVVARKLEAIQPRGCRGTSVLQKYTEKEVIFTNDLA